ncbi:MAG: AraC family transcriptional regulator [Legionella sp.]|nr:AraC family transcriptional regulator [Legionella sp.]
MKQATAANYLGILEKCLKQCGIDDFFKDIGFDATRVNDSSAYLSAEEFNYIIREAYERSRCPYLGLLFGEHLSIINHGFLGYAAMTSPTLKTALQTFLSFLNIRTSLLRGHLFEEFPDKSFVEFTLLSNDPVIDRFLTEMAVVHLAKQRIFLINATTPCLRIELAYPRPLYDYYYQQTLHTQVEFDAKVTRVWFLTDELNALINFADDASYQQAKLQLQTLAETLTDKNELPARIKKILYSQDLYTLNMEIVASQLCMSTRTLRRHLQRYQLTYQDIFDEVRAQKAKEWLENSQLSITEISFLLGFHDISNFSKAFKRWTNLTPTNYREQHTSE